MKPKKLTEFQKKIIDVVKYRRFTFHEYVVNGLDIAAGVFPETWKKNRQAHARLVGRISQEHPRIADYVTFHGAADQWATFGFGFIKHYEDEDK